MTTGECTTDQATDGAGLPVGAPRVGGRSWPAAMMPRIIVIQGSLDLDPDDADKFEAIVLPLQRASATEPGCISYHFSRDLEVPGRFRVAECWESDDALKVHFT